MRRTVKALTIAVPDGIRFPRAEEAVWIIRTRITGAKTSRETVYFTVSHPPSRPNSPIYMTGPAAHGPSKTAYITPEMLLSVTSTRHAPAPGPPSWPLAA
ncbi:hypothetical protein GCM10011608_11380 [Micromonospora sonchi]|uniref:Uncharacterized protein n=1 Tax=Micromonospora sonchi TaxID=1763543 RepID=A0A917TM07_9ACTN|nr:hypothetical protein GCM10011608_11380 [Micromonospora sonchi]